MRFKLSAGQVGDGPQGRELIQGMKSPKRGCALAMDRAYEGDETRQLARKNGFTPITPAHPHRLKPWRLNKTLYKRRNEVERLFRRLKGFRRIATRYDKLDVTFSAYIRLALIFIALN